MRHTMRLLALGGVVLLLAVGAAPMQAEDGATFEGGFILGFRSVDVGGAETKYREDLNLEDGPRLFDLHFDLTPSAELREFVDQIQLNITNFGGDPFETMSLRMRKNGRYELKYDRREADYFYQDTILPPELADIRLSSGGDFHHFDFRRVSETAQLKYQVSRAAKLSFGFNRMTKIGESTTTLDISRDEFELDKPIDESLDLYTAGFEYAWDKVTLVLEESYRQYDNQVDIFLPGFSLGENPTGASLDFFFLEQPYDLTSNQHTVRVVARPNPRLTILAGAVIQNSEIDVAASERSQGLSFNGSPFTTDLSGSGKLDRDVELFDVDVSYRINARFAVVGGAWSKALDQKGDFTFGGSLNEGLYKIDTTGAEAGLEYQASPKLVLAAGLLQESRDVEHAAEEGATGGALDREKETTDNTGFYASAAWRPSKQLQWTTRYEDSSFDDPFTLVSPTDRQRLRTRVRYHWGEGLSLTGSYYLLRTENNNSGWQGDTDQLQARFGYHRGPVSFSLGYGVLQIDRQIAQVVLGNPLPIFYEIDTDFLDGSVRWEVNPSWAVGADARLYDNSGSFGLKRDDWRGWVEALCGQGYVVRAGYRTVDYDETAANFDDYNADILELGFGYRWGGSPGS